MPMTVLNREEQKPMATAMQQDSLDALDDDGRLAAAPFAALSAASEIREL